MARRTKTAGALVTRTVLPVLALAWLGACGAHEPSDLSSSPTESAGTGTASATQALESRHARSLERAFGTTVSVEVSRELGTVRHLEGRIDGLLGPTALAKTHDFLTRAPELLGLRRPSSALALVREETSESGTHVRLQQIVSGVPVRGSEVVAHFDGDTLVALDARIVADLEIEVRPVLSVLAAEARAKDELFARVPSLGASDVRQGKAPELVVFAEPGRAPRLAYHHVVRASSATEVAVLDVTVDALDGTLLEAFDDLETLKTSAPGVLGDTKQFEVTDSGGGTFSLIDKTRPAEIRTYTAATQQSLPGALATSTQIGSWDNVAKGKGAVVDAHFYAGFVYDYYKTKFGRNGLDGANSPMISTAHFGINYDNAFWDGTQMAYGDGGTRFKALSAGLDVVGHEFTHGVTTSTSNLVYQGQPGALNEAISDIFSCFIEHQYKADDRANWLTGETIGIGGAIRDLSNPKSKGQPSHMKEFVNTQQDNGGVHINSGIPNNAAYLMTMGGSNPYSKVAVNGKIGWEKAEKLWYEIETKYLTSRADFKAAATASLTAAQALKYTATEIAVIKCAWIAVGVTDGTCDPLVSAPSTPDAGAPTTDAGTATPSPSSSARDAGSTPPPSSTPNGLLGTPRDDSGCNQSGSGSRDFGAMFGVALALGALATRKRRPLR